MSSNVLLKRSDPKSINKSPKDIDKVHTNCIPLSKRGQKQHQRNDSEMVSRVDQSSTLTNSEGEISNCIKPRSKQENVFPNPPVFLPFLPLLKMKPI
jgi:hypothetical protein